MFHGGDHARIRGVERGKASWHVRLIYWFARRALGQIPAGMEILALHPGLLRQFVRMNMLQQKQGTLPSGLFADAEKNVLRFAVSLSGAPADASEELFAVMRRDLSERQLVELALVIAQENFQPRFNRTFAIESAGFSKGAFCPLPER